MTMALKTLSMVGEFDLEELLRDDIMARVLRSAGVTPDDLRRQIAALAEHRRAERAPERDESTA